MIIFEDEIAKIVDIIPSIFNIYDESIQPRFNWGTQDVLNKFIVVPENESKYPLVWLVDGGEETHTVANKRSQRDVKFVILKNSESPNDFNQFIYNTEFDKVLNPVAQNLITAFDQLAHTKIVNDTYKIRRYTNYSETVNKTKTLDIVNAITLELTLELRSDRCTAKQIKF